jgi:hypothetical protein
VGGRGALSVDERLPDGVIQSSVRGLLHREFSLNDPGRATRQLGSAAGGRERAGLEIERVMRPTRVLILLAKKPDPATED